MNNALNDYAWARIAVKSLEAQVESNLKAHPHRLSVKMMFNRYSDDVAHAFRKYLTDSGSVTACEKYEHTWHCNCAPADSCYICEQEKQRLAKGIKQYRYRLTIQRNEVPNRFVDVPLVAPRHRRCGTNAYHRRIQKKWDAQARNKKGVAFAQISSVLDVSASQMRIITNLK